MDRPVWGLGVRQISDPRADLGVDGRRPRREPSYAAKADTLARAEPSDGNHVLRTPAGVISQAAPPLRPRARRRPP